MPIKLITSLDQLEPGMKTKDGHRFDGKTSYGSYSVWFPTKGLVRSFGMVVLKETAEHIFLNQEVEVPE